MAKNNLKVKLLYKHIPANTCAIKQHAEHTTDQLTLLLAAKQKPYEKADFLTKNIEEYSGEKGQENRTLAEKKKKEKTVKATRVYSGTKDEKEKWNLMTAMRFRLGGRHRTFPDSLRGMQ